MKSTAKTKAAAPSAVAVQVTPLVGSGDPEVYSVEEFCRRHGLSRAYYYGALKPKGLEPAETRLGRKVVIYREAAAAWRCRHVGQHLPAIVDATGEDQDEASS